MECPLCNKPMKHVHADVTHNPNENNKEYDRVVYACEADDVWITTEIPK